MRIKRIEVGQLKANCYLLVDEVTDECLIIDSGDDADFIQRIIADENVKPLAIIATHAHFDHILAAFELKLAYQIPFLVHQKDEFLVKEMRNSAKYFLGLDPGPPPTIDQYLSEEKLVIGNFTLKVIPTPGHTPGSVSLYDHAQRVVFVGDLVFADGYLGRVDFSYSSKRDLKTSVGRILKLPEEVVVYSGHGRQTRIGEIKRARS